MKCELKSMKKNIIKGLKSINKFDVTFIIVMTIIYIIIQKYTSLYLIYAIIGILLLTSYLIERNKCKERILKKETINDKNSK